MRGTICGCMGPRGSPASHTPACDPGDGLSRDAPHLRSSEWVAIPHRTWSPSMILTSMPSSTSDTVPHPPSPSLLSSAMSSSFMHYVVFQQQSGRYPY